MAHSKFTMIPNVVFDLLTNDCDLVAYQKMIRFIGMGNSFKGGVRALSAKIGVSVGKITKLGATLKAVGFIEILKGDNSHGESDTWKMLDIWHLNTCSPNDTGQEMEESEDLLNGVNTHVQPVHETTQPRSPNDTATCSRNDTHKEKIFTEEYIQDLVEESNDSSFVRLSANDGELRKAICSKIGQKLKTSEITTTEWNALIEIFGFWKQTFGKNSSTRLTTERGRAVLDRLRSFQNFTIEEIKQAISGCKLSPNHNGTNGKVFDDLELICRTDDFLARFIGHYEAAEILSNGAIIKNGTGIIETDQQRRNREAGERNEFFGNAKQILAERDRVLQAQNESYPS